MSKNDSRRAFLINFIYIALWCVLAFCFLKFALPVLMPFVLAFGVAFALKPLINKISNKTKMGRKLVAVLVLSLLYIVVIVLLVWLGTGIVSNVGKLFRFLPGYFQNTVVPGISTLGEGLEVFLAKLDPAILEFLETSSATIISSLTDLVKTVSSGVVGGVTNFASRIPIFVVSFVLMIITSYFFVVDYYKITSFLKKQLSEKMRRRLVIVKDYVLNVLLKFARAYFLIMFITFCELLVGFLILREPGAVLLAAVIALLDIFPVFGSGTVLVPWILYSFITGDLFHGIGMLIMYVVIAFVRQIIEPRIVGKQIGLYPLLTLIAMFVGTRVFGFWGLFAFPIAITVAIHMNRIGEITLFKN